MAALFSANSERACPTCNGLGLVYTGTPADLVAHGDTLTAQHLRAYVRGGPAPHKQPGVSRTPNLRLLGFPTSADAFAAYHGHLGPCEKECG